MTFLKGIVQYAKDQCNVADLLTLTEINMQDGRPVIDSSVKPIPEKGK
ncbi:MAG: hypothetical protein K9I94_10690 [Bacteroidales bacterium]|nr:hypothetical protein [Bacteroidales bacterium]